MAANSLAKVVHYGIEHKGAIIKNRDRECMLKTFSLEGVSSKGGAPCGRDYSAVEESRRSPTAAINSADALEIPAATAIVSPPQPSRCDWQSTSLYSGGGGLDLGFLLEGIRPNVAYDNHRFALEHYRQNVLDVTVEHDLTEYFSTGPTEVLLAGAPCQGFSTVGKRLLNDPRNEHLLRVAEVAVRMKPRVVVIENVPAALSGQHRRSWIAVEDRLRLNGYNVRRLYLHGEESGVPQRRRRLFMLCWRGSDCIRVELSPLAAPPLRAALAALPADGLDGVEWLRPGSAGALIAQHIGPGQKLSDVRVSERAVPSWSIPEVFGPTNSAQRDVLVALTRLRRRSRRRSFGDGDPVPVTVLATQLGRIVESDVATLLQLGYLRQCGNEVDLRHTYNGRFRRLAWNEAAPTVDTYFGRASLFLHPDQPRGMSPREAARIQGFPDWYRLEGQTKAKFQLVGNAVPPPMAVRVANFVREAILKS